MMCSPVTGAGHQHTEQVVDDEGEDDGGDGAAGDGVAGVLQLAWGAERVTYSRRSCKHDARAHSDTPTHT